MTDTRTLREHAVAALAAYDRDNPMRTADWHGDDCDCFRCEMDRLRTILDAHPAPAQPEKADAVGEADVKLVNTLSEHLARQMDTARYDDAAKYLRSTWIKLCIAAAITEGRNP